MLIRQNTSSQYSPQDLSDSVEAFRLLSIDLVSRDKRSELGQFMTPWEIAQLLASKVELSKRKETISILDAGAGIGSLTAALISRLIEKKQSYKTISVTLFEYEKEFIPLLKKTLKECACLCESNDIQLTYKIIQKDFIEEASLNISGDILSSWKHSEFDIAILNPPYKKLKSNSHQRQMLRKVGIETSNLYSAFVALSISLLEINGQCIAITPRSFCNGPYFTKFRKLILKDAKLTDILLFHSRTSAFSDDKVLQENIIYKLVKTEHKSKHPVRITTSNDSHDGFEERIVPYESVVYPDDSDFFIHIPDSDEAQEAVSFIRALPSTLTDLKLTVSTGRVVGFRTRNNLRKKPTKKTIPLIYPAHCNQGKIMWPLTNNDKNNAIVKNKKTENLLIPSGTYILVKRFSSKEERRRVVASLLSPSIIKSELYGIDNKLNYFHVEGEGVKATLAKGLVLYLNSSVVDKAFRQFSGHTQVNATDLRKMRYPDCNQLIAIAKKYKKSLSSQDEIDEIVMDVLR